MRQVRVSTLNPTLNMPTGAFFSASRWSCPTSSWVFRLKLGSDSQSLGVWGRPHTWLVVHQERGTRGLGEEA